MNLLYIHNDYGMPSGEEHAAEAIVRLLTQNGHAVRWFRRSSAELGRSLRGQVKGFCAGIYNPFSAAALNRLLRDFRPDLVQVQNIYPLISPSIFAVLRRFRLPVVMRCPNYRLFCPNGLHLVNGEICERCLGPGREWWCVVRNCEGSRLKSAGYALRNIVARISRSIVDNVHVFLVQSEFQKGKFIHNGLPAERIAVIPGMTFSSAPPGSVSPGEVVTFAGRISREKGIGVFLDAARLLPEIRFVIAGNDGQMPGIRDRAPANVEWLGFIGNEELRRLYLRSRIVVVPSICYEAFPNVLIQAMRLGKPVVCSALGGMPEIIGQGSAGLLSKPGHAGDLATKIRLLYANPELCRQLGSAGRQRVLQEYCPPSVYRRLMEAFSRAMQLSGRGSRDHESEGRRSAGDAPADGSIPALTGECSRGPSAPDTCERDGHVPPTR